LITNSSGPVSAVNSRREPLASNAENCSSCDVPIARFWALLVAALLIAGPLSAQEESVHLDYAASAGCPDRAAFVAEITARTTRARFVDEARDVRTFTATIRTQGGRTLGSLISNSGQMGAERRVTGKTCSEVVSALALITALAIDPSASTSQSSPAPPDSSTSPKLKVDATAATNVDAKSTTESVSATEKGHGPSTTSSWGLSVGAEGEGSYGLTSERANLTMLGGSVHVEMGPFVQERRGPLFRVGALLLESPTPVPDAQALGEATFTLVAGRVGVSPFYIRIANAFELHPWLSVEIGRLHGSGSKAPDSLLQTTADGNATWLAAGEGMEGRWSLGHALWLAMELRAVEPLVRKGFVFKYQPRPADPIINSVPITSVPYFEGILGLGLGGSIL
jgi:hypothetical protein